jgi:hypothetical protein
MNEYKQLYYQLIVGQYEDGFLKPLTTQALCSTLIFIRRRDERKNSPRADYLPQTEDGKFSSGIGRISS